MEKNIEFKKPVYSFLPSEQKVNALYELALDLRWSWDHSADEVWRQLDPVLWDITHSPWAVLQTVSRDRFKELSNDPCFAKDRVFGEVEMKATSRRHGFKSTTPIPR